MRRTKIVCTIGPASQSVVALKELLKQGMNVARLNFSHGSHEEHLERINNIRQASKETNIPVAIMLDTKGPEIRTGVTKDNAKIQLDAGKKIILTTEEVEGTPEKITISYKELYRDVKVGSTILIDDGLIGLEVEAIKGEEIHCAIVNGGEISSRKGVNVPNVDISLPAITEKDFDDITFAIRNNLDFIAASFIRSASDVLEIRKILEDHDSGIHIISKIENRQGVNNIDEIILVSDGLMVARGDLGVEIPAEEVPLVQKMMIRKCNAVGKPVITATQMLDSMIRNPRPTRAEASDVANAIFDGTDAIMLSGETAAGKYPLQAVQTMHKIAMKAESALRFEEVKGHAIRPEKTMTDAISHATCTTAHDLGASAIITATQSGSTARMVSKYRPTAPIVAATPDERVLRKLLLKWGVFPVLSPKTDGTDEMIQKSVESARNADLIKCGDLIVITAGVPVGVAGTTNLLKVHVVGEVIAKGMGIGKGAITGKVVVATTPEDALTRVNIGDVLVTIATDRDFIPAMEKAGAIITEEGGLTSHGAIVGLNLGKTTVVGVIDGTHILRDGGTVTVDGVRGLIYQGKATVL